MPINGAPNQSLTLTLTSGAFSDPDAGDVHAASQWLIKRASDGVTVFDSGTDTADKTSCPVSAGKLSYSTSYSWQVRYQDNHGAWSSYSTATAFTTQAAPADQPPVVNTFTPTPSTVTVGQSVNLIATASDPDAGDSISAVKFYEGNTLLGNGSFSSGQWSFSWNTSGHSTGSFTLSAIAYDASNTASIAKTASVTINASTGSVKLTGTILGTAGSFGGSTNTKDKAMDGNTSTYFDAPHRQWCLGRTGSGQRPGDHQGPLLSPLRPVRADDRRHLPGLQRPDFLQRRGESGHDHQLAEPQLE